MRFRRFEGDVAQVQEFKVRLRQESLSFIVSRCLSVIDVMVAPFKEEKITHAARECQLSEVQP